MKTRKQSRRQRGRQSRRQRGGIKCRDSTSWTPIPYESNSCWLDTFLIAFLHYPVDYIDQLLDDAKGSIDLMMRIPQNKEAIVALKRHEKHLVKDVRNPFTTAQYTYKFCSGVRTKTNA